MADQRIFDEAVFREAVTRFEVNSDPASAQRIVTGVGQVLRMLDAARAEIMDARSDRDGFVDEIRDLNDQLAGARANVTALKTSCRALESLVDELRAEARRLADQVRRVRNRHWRHEDGTDEGLCNECRTPSPCAEIRALDWTEAGR